MRRRSNGLPVLFLTLLIGFVSLSAPLRAPGPNRGASAFEPKIDDATDTSSESAFEFASVSPKEERGCKAMVDDYCTQLHSAKAKGNLKIGSGAERFIVTQGETTNNFDSAEFAFYRASLDARRHLPSDLAQALENRGFFRDLRFLLARPPRKEMRLQDRIRYTDLESAVSNSWELAFDEITLKRLNKKHPRSHVLEDASLPREIELEKIRIRQTLWSEVSIAVWSKHPSWKRVEVVFQDLKKAFVQVIKEFGIPDEIKQEWIAKVESVKLSLPGFTPAVANSDCIRMSRNAYYYPYLNTLTVCAGYFTGADQIQTLAHELSHSIDFSTRLVDFQQASSLGREMRALRGQLCSNRESFTCEAWGRFRERFDGWIAETKGRKADLPNFQQCLKKAPTKKLITDPDLERLADRSVRRRFSDMAKKASFLRIVKKKVPLPSGETIDNGSYLNPCGYNLWNFDLLALDSEFTSLMFFTAAYRCSQATDESQRIREAVDLSREFSTKVALSTLALEGEFSAREIMQEEDLSSPPNERFADRMGSYIVGTYLETHVKQNERRREAFLASSFWLCSKPSLRTANYAEYQALSDMIIDRTVHLENDDRIKDWLSPAVRRSLSCDADFRHSECDLPRLEDSN